MAAKRYIPGHEVRLVHSGEEYFSLLKDIIGQAKNTLYLQYYIFDQDHTGEEIATALIAAAAKGVRVYLMVDGFGSYGLESLFISKMRVAGVEFRYFNPLPFPGITQAARRLHHKVCVADGQHALVGGINIADKYRGDAKQHAWYDFAVDVKGIACQMIEESCKEIWTRRYIGRKPLRLSPVSEKGILVRVCQNDWVRGKNQISASYKQMLKSAHHSIDIVASYFIPTRRLLKILLRSAQHGRQIRIVLSRNSDVPFIKSATDYLYERLLQAGVHIYEYETSILHAKVCIVDKRWSTIGSHNLNHLSEFMSVEMNIEVNNRHFSEAFSEDLERMMKEDCKEVKFEEFRFKSSVHERLKRWLSFRLLSFIQRVLYMLNRKEAVMRKR